jgi:hypothetical protein
LKKFQSIKAGLLYEISQIWSIFRTKESIKIPDHPMESIVHADYSSFIITVKNLILEGLGARLIQVSALGYTD